MFTLEVCSDSFFIGGGAKLLKKFTKSAAEGGHNDNIIFRQCQNGGLVSSTF